MAAEYDAETADFWDRFPRAILNEFTKRVGKGIVADIGSGPGRDGLIIQKSGCEVMCLDASQTMVDMCIKKGLNAVKGVFGLGLIEGEGESYRMSSGVDKPRLFAYYTKAEIEGLVAVAGFDIEYMETFKPGSKQYLNYILRKKL